MIWIDWIFAAFLAWAIYQGIKKGFILELAGLFGLIAGIYLGSLFAKSVALYLHATIHLEEPYLRILSFALIFLCVLLGIRLLAKLVEKTVELAMLGWLNKLLGAVFSVLKVMFLISLALMLLNSFIPGGSLLNGEQRKKSLFYEPVQALAPYLTPKIKPLLQPKKELEKKEENKTGRVSIIH